MARNTRQMGGRYENEVCAMAEALGYCAFPARGSRGPVDIVAFEAASALDFVPRYTEPLVSLAIQVGTTAKPIARTLEDLEAAPRPIGSVCVVARRVRAANRRVSWRFHSSAGTFATLAEAIDGGRAPSA